MKYICGIFTPSVELVAQKITSNSPKSLRAVPHRHSSSAEKEKAHHSSILPPPLICFTRPVLHFFQY